MKNIFLLFLFILAQTFLQAQDVAELSGKEAGLKDFPKLNDFRNIDGVFYKTWRENITRENRSVYHIERYSNDLLKKYSADIEFPNEKEEVEGLYFTDKGICLFSSFFDKKEDKLTLFLTIADKETGKITSKKKEVLVMHNDANAKHFRMWFDLQLSEDKTKLALLSNFDPRGEPCQSKVTVYDFPSMKSTTQFEVPTMAGEITLLQINLFYMTKDGIVYYDYSYEVKKDDPHFRRKTVVAYNTNTKTSKSKEFGAGTKKYEDGYTQVFQKGNSLYYVGSLLMRKIKKIKRSVYSLKYLI